MRRKKFIEYVCEKFGEKISGSVLNFILKNRGIIESYIPSRYSLKYIEIDNIEYKTVYIDSKEGNRIEFDLVVVPEVDCSIRNIRNDDYDRELVDDLWLSVACTGDVSKSLSDFRIISVNEYFQQKPKKPLSDDLVPIIPKADYEKYAKELLEKYYPECIERLEIVDPVIIAQRMGLQILKRSIAEDGSIFGQIFFKDAEVGLFNKEHKCIEKVKVPRNTIIVDADATSLFSLGSVNITIAHECVHYYLHKKAFYFAQMLNDNLTQIQCQTSGGWKGEEETSRNNWMEIQANGIAPYINNKLIKEIVIPDKVTEIKKYAFHGWNGTSITIPDSVTSIGEDAFENCSSLTRITFQGTKAQWDAIRKGSYWNYNTGRYTVYCKDGAIYK